MTNSRCPNQNCDSLKSTKGSSFILKEANISTEFKYYLVQCSSCGTVIGIIEGHYTKTLIDNINIPEYDPFLLNDDKYKAIMDELNIQSEAIKRIMEKININF